MSNEERKKLLGQIILRIDDEHGHHIIRKHDYGYTIEGYSSKPDNYLNPPQYYFPFSRDEVASELAKNGKEFRE